MVHRSKGAVLINGAGAGTGAPVSFGDRVSTGPDGEAVFVVGDDGFLLRSDSQARVVDLGSNPRTGQPVRELILESGAILSVFGPKEITLKTPLASVGIRGTAAYLESFSGSMNMCVCYGHAIMSPVGAPDLSEEVQNRHHETPRIVTPGPTGPVMRPYLMMNNHTDEELIMLEALFGRNPPFVVK